MSSQTNNALCECSRPASIRRNGRLICETCARIDSQPKRERSGHGWDLSLCYRRGSAMTPRRFN